jgi:hypothetical protein
MLLRGVRSLTRAEPQLRQNLVPNSRRLYSAALTLSSLSLTRPFTKPRAVRPCLQTSQRRGAKRKATVALDDMQQGAIEADALPPQDDAEPEYPPLLQQVRNNMLKFSHCVVLTRVGGFYEVCASLGSSKTC